MSNALFVRSFVNWFVYFGFGSHQEVLVGAVRRLKNTALDAVEMSHAVERQLGPLVQAGNGH
eukprot:7029996-Pyramimonas_sp.AAC.1